MASFSDGTRLFLTFLTSCGFRKSFTRYLFSFHRSFFNSTSWEKKILKLLSKLDRTTPDKRPTPVANGWSAVEMRVFTRFNSSITEGPTKRRTEGVSYRFGCPPLKKNREICRLPSSAKLLWFWFELQELDQIMPSLALALALSYTDANHIPKKLF